MRAGNWIKASYPLTTSLCDQKVGIVGMGRIGQEIARLCLAFGCHLAYYGPRQKPVDYTYYERVEDLVSWADILVIACPGGSGNP